MISRIISQTDDLLNNLAKGLSASSIRFNNRWAYQRNDDNLFALASAALLLSQSSPRLNLEQQERLLSQILKLNTFFEAYKNKDDRETYNFYKTKPSRHFPNGCLMHRFDHFRLADDIDDTALVFLSTNKPKQEVSQLKQLAESHAVTVSLNYHPKRVFSTWFGKNMPADIDVCALLNLLTLFQKHHELSGEIVDNTILFLKQEVVSNRIFNQPFWAARHYANVPLILYHYARFMENDNLGYFNELKEFLIEKAKEQILKESVFLNIVLLETSLIKWGIERSKIAIPLDWQTGFYSFIGAPLGPFEAKFNLSFFSKIAASSLTHIYWKSDLHENAILLEYLSFFENSSTSKHI
jgi:hypothetical protein